MNGLPILKLAEVNLLESGQVLCLELRCFFLARDDISHQVRQLGQTKLSAVENSFDCCVADTGGLQPLRDRSVGLGDWGFGNLTVVGVGVDEGE